MITPAVLIWAAVLVLGVPLAVRLRHPDTRPLAASLIFVVALTATAAVMFVLASRVAVAAGWSGALERPLGAIVFLLAVFAPGLAVAIWQARKPPRRPPRI
jgi:hypothetical protein